MKYAQVGRSGLIVERPRLGTMNFGPYLEEIVAHRMMDRAHEAG